MDRDEGDHPTTPATHGYPSGTDGYPLSSDGRPGGPEEPPSGSAEPSDEGQETEQDLYWRRLGFGSHQEFLDGLERNQAKLDQWFPSARRRSDPPAASVPGREIGEVGVVKRAPVRQVGIKLRPADYEALASAALLYGLRPTTMARLLVNRGVRAALESHDEQSR
jgi:hypothetical protein